MMLINILVPSGIDHNNNDNDPNKVKLHYLLIEMSVCFWLQVWSHVVLVGVKDILPWRSKLLLLPTHYYFIIIIIIIKL